MTLPDPPCQGRAASAPSAARPAGRFPPPLDRTGREPGDRRSAGTLTAIARLPGTPQASRPPPSPASGARPARQAGRPRTPAM